MRLTHNISSFIREQTIYYIKEQRNKQKERKKTGPRIAEPDRGSNKQQSKISEAVLSRENDGRLATCMTGEGSILLRYHQPSDSQWGTAVAVGHLGPRSGWGWACFSREIRPWQGFYMRPRYAIECSGSRPRPTGAQAQAERPFEKIIRRRPLHVQKHSGDRVEQAPTHSSVKQTP